MTKSRNRVHQKVVPHKKRSKKRIVPTPHVSHSRKPHRTQHHKTVHTNGRNSESLSRSAAHLIDEAAGLLKQGMSMGIRAGAKGHEIFKKEAFQVVNSATKNLNEIVNTGSDYIRMGIKKI